MRNAHIRLTIVIAGTVMLAAMVPLLGRATGVRSNQEDPPDPAGSCTSAVSGTLSSLPIRVCEMATATSRAGAACPACPDGINVVFVRMSISRGWQAWLTETSLSAVREMVRFAPLTDSPVRVGVVDYVRQGVARTELDLTDQLDLAEQAMKRWPVTASYGEWEEGAEQALRVLRDTRTGGPDSKRCEIVVMSFALKEHPGVDYRDLQESMRQAAGRIHRENVTLMVTCPLSPQLYCKTSEDLPKSRRYLFTEPNTSRLAKVMREDMEFFVEDEGVADLRLTHQLPSELTYVDGSARPALDQLLAGRDGTSLSWRWRYPDAAGPHTVTYRAKPFSEGPEAEGVWPITGALLVTDRLTRTLASAMDPLPVIVSGLCEPTPTPTPVPSATPAHTETPTATATPTRAPVPVYLPLAVNERCDPTLVRADIALVLDTSSSMTGRKVADAKEAAITFVRLLDLAPGRDQVSVVRFDSEAELVAELTADRPAIEEAILGLETRQGTHIDLGLKEALSELQSPRRMPDNVPVMVLLTDGIQTGAAGAEIKAARDVRDAGVGLYTIGLGADVDEATLLEMAGEPSRYYFAPDSSHLERVYGEVARDIDCPAEDYWGRR